MKEYSDTVTTAEIVKDVKYWLDRASSNKLDWPIFERKVEALEERISEMDTKERNEAIKKALIKLEAANNWITINAPNAKNTVDVAEQIEVIRNLLNGAA